MTQTGSVVITLVYDGDGLRRRSQTASDTTRFIWDDQDVLIETNDAGTTQTNYTQTPAEYGDLVAQRRSNTSKFYVYDALGSTSELTDSSQTQTDSYRYYAFGKGLASSGSTVNPYQYVGNLGYYNESGLSLQYLRARWYNPNTGRFVSEDPLHRDGGNNGQLEVMLHARGIGRFGRKDIMKQSADLYVYANNAPINLTDPSGLYTNAQCSKRCSLQNLMDSEECKDEYRKCKARCWRWGPARYVCEYFYCSGRWGICQHRATNNLVECGQWCEGAAHGEPCDGADPGHHNPPYHDVW